MIWWILWFVAGFATFLLACAVDMRGVPYNRCFTNQECLVNFAVMSTVLGCVSLVIFIMVRVIEDELFSKLVYWLCNIGVKKEEDQTDE